MGAGVVLDTSYLITLADSGRTHHKTALRYWQQFTEEGIPLYLSTIVVSEFCIRQELPPPILRACVLLPFNWDDALKTAELDFSTFKREGDSRDALKDDVKIIAQAIVKDASFVITDDTKTFFQFAQNTVQAGSARFRPIKLEDGFDVAFFNEGQRQLSLESESEADDPTV